MTEEIKVAVVDDHVVVRRGVTAVLEHEPLLRVLRTAASAEELLTAGVLDVDVVLLDVDLRNDSDPAENVAALTAAGVRVLLYTSEQRPALLRRVLAAGALGLVLKDDDEEDLRAAVLAAGRGEIHVNSELAAEILADPVGGVGLSPREREVLTLLAAGLTWSGVASALGISVSTARTHMAHVLQAFESEGLTLRDGPREAVARALGAGHIDRPASARQRRR